MSATKGQALGAILAISGCTLPDEPPPGHAASPCDTGGGALALELGETVDGAFVPIDPQDEPELVFGPQGGHHLDLALRVDGLGPAPVEPLLSIAAEQAGAPVGSWQRILDDPRAEDTEGPVTWLDLRLVVIDWSAGTERRVTATLADERCGSEGAVEAVLDAAPSR